MAALPRSREETLWAVAERVVPEVSSLDPAGRERFAAIVERALLDRPPGVRRQVAAFLGVLRWLPAGRWGRRFERLAPACQDRFLAWLQECPLSLFQRGFWGLKALVFMGYYGQPEVWPSLRYTPSFNGNERLHG